MPTAHGGAQAIYDPSPSHSALSCSGYSCPVAPLLLQLYFSVSSPTVARPASLPLPLQVRGQGLACGAGCWLPEGVSDPAPLPPQYLLGLWFLSRSLPQIFILDLLRPTDFVDAPQTCVEECLDLLLLRLCCPPCLTSVEQDSLQTGVEDAELGSHADSSRCPEVFVHDESSSCLADYDCDVSVCASLLVNHASQVNEDPASLLGSPPIVTGVLAVVFIFISSVFFLLILSPVPADVVSRRVVLSCIWL